MVKKFVQIVGLALGLLALPLIAQADQLVVSGSTTVQKRILEPTAAAFQKATGHELTVRGINSGKGFTELVEGKVKASISSNPLPILLSKASLTDDGSYKEHVIMQDSIVPIVHPENLVTELSWQQLSDINTGKITNWKDVGGQDQAIVVITSQPTAATRVFFQEEVMKKAEYVQGAREVTSTRQEIESVNKFKGGIGAVSEAFANQSKDKVKVVKTDKISRPLSIITKGEPDPVVKSLIDFLLTPDAQKLFQ